MSRWKDYRRRLKLTRDGKWFVGLSLAIGFAAINTGNNLLFLIFGMTLGLIVLSGMLAETNLRNVELRRLPARLFAQTPGRIPWVAHLSGRRLHAWALEARVRYHVHGRDEIFETCILPLVRPGEKQTARGTAAFPRRGIYRTNGIVLSTRFPFGLFEKGRMLDLDEEVVVFPALRAVTELGPQRAPVRQGPAARFSKNLAEQGDFMGVKDYVPGDDARRIHWKASAKSGKWLSKVFEDPPPEGCRLGWAARPGEPDAQTEERLSLLASHVYTLVRRGLAVHLHFAGDPVRTISSEPELWQWLGQLARLDPAALPPTNLRGFPPGTHVSFPLGMRCPQELQALPAAVLPAAKGTT